MGEAFDRLDALARRVMQALAVFTTPVPAVAVDYLLQPYEAAIDSAPVLRRLVNAGFAHCDQGRYYLHPVDRAYALGRLPPGGSTPGAALELNLLLQRAADYFASVRTPRQSWRSLEDLGPQLAEFDLRCQAQDYGEAATVLGGVDFDYLFQWGHYRYLIKLRQRLDGNLKIPRQQGSHLSSLGSCHYALGGYRLAIELHKRPWPSTARSAIAAAKPSSWAPSDSATTSWATTYWPSGGRTGPGHRPPDRRPRRRSHQTGQPRARHRALGDYRLAIALHEQALTIDRQIGYRSGESVHLGNLGACHRALGDYRLAIALHEQALAIARRIGYRRGESVHLANLGACHRALGDYRLAIALHEQALAIARRIGNRYVEAMALTHTGDALGALGEVSEAQHAYDGAIVIADNTAELQSQVEARCGLAETYLLTGDLQAAHAVLGRLGSLDYPPRHAVIPVVSGLASLLTGDPERAREALSASIDQADDRLTLAEGEVASWDVMGLAHAGLAVLGDTAPGTRR